MADGRAAQPDPERARRRGQDILHVVLAAQTDLGQRQHRLHVTVELGDDEAVAHEHPVVEHPLTAEPEHVRPRARRQRRRRRVVGVQHGAVGRRLVQEDPCLRVGVAREVAVTVEVVGREVEHRRHPWLERLDRLELERRDLGHHEAVDGERERVGGQRRPDVATDQHRPRLLGQQRAGEGRRRRLAVRPGDGDRLGLHRAPAELQLADERHAPRPRRGQLGAVERHAGTHHHEGGAVEGALAHHVAHERHAGRAQGRRLAPERLHRLGVHRHDLGVHGAQQARRRDPTLRHPDNNDPPPPPRHQPPPPPRHHANILLDRVHATPRCPTRSPRASSDPAERDVRLRLTTVADAPRRGGFRWGPSDPFPPRMTVHGAA